MGIDREKMFSIGNRVVHSRFGLGWLRAIRRDGAIQVQFDISGFKWIRPEHLRIASGLTEAAARRCTWPQGTFVDDAPDAIHPMGCRWAPFGLAAEDVLSQIPAWLAHATVIETTSHDRDTSRHVAPSSWPRGVLLTGPDMDRAVNMVLCLEDDRTWLVSLFPSTQLGTQLTLRLQQVTLWRSGLEAHITATWGDASIRFFDSRFVNSRARYETGRLYDFIVSGLAYGAWPAQEITFPLLRVSTELLRLAERQSRSQDQGTQREAVQCSTRGAAWMLPAVEGDVDEYHFRGPIQKLSPFRNWLGQEGWTARTTVLRFGPDGSDQDLDIHITRHAWTGPTAPCVGQEIQGVLWLQGHFWSPNLETPLTPPPFRP